MQVLPEPFVVAEEKRLVLLDRPSRGSTKLVPLKRRSGTLVEEIRRIQRVVAQILERRSMPLIRSRSRHNHDLAARPFAEFGSVRVPLHVEFAHCVHAQQRAARSSRLKIILGSAGKLHSVQQEEILLWPVPGNSEVVSRGGIRYSGPADFFGGEIHDARIQRQQQIIAPPIQRKIFYLLFPNQARDISCACAHDGRISKDPHFRLHRAHL